LLQIILYFAVSLPSNDIERKKEMAYKTKDEYQRHTENAHKRQSEMRENIATLTEEQHEALSQVCSIRHELHSNQKSLFCSESSKYSTLLNYLDGGVKEILNSANLKNSLSWNIIDLPSDYDCEDPDKGLTEVFSFVSKVNSEIENYLREIDEVHGTSYCPTGALRVM
jgi:hypothetical protein